MTDSSPPLGVLLVGHGTRDPRGLAEFLETVRLVTAMRPDFVVRHGFLELATPTIQEAVDELLAREVARVIVAPLLLFAAGHARQDLPAAVRQALSMRPELPRVQASPLGLHEAIVELSRQRCRECLAPLPPLAAADSLLLMVGRGSGDPAATAEMHALAELRKQDMPGMEVRTAFVAVAQPSLDQAIQRIRRLPIRRVIVQPHLLFAGQVLNQVRELVELTDRETDRQQWTMAPHLGVSSLVAEAVIGRILRAIVQPTA